MSGSLSRSSISKALLESFPPKGHKGQRSAVVGGGGAAAGGGHQARASNPPLRSRGRGGAHGGEMRVPSAASAAGENTGSSSRSPNPPPPPPSSSEPSSHASPPPPPLHVSPPPSPPPHTVRFEEVDVDADDLCPGDAADEDEAAANNFKEVLGALEQHGLLAYRPIFILLNALFVLIPLLEKAGFNPTEIRRFYKLLVKAHAPKPPRDAAARCPRRTQSTFKGRIPQGSTSRLEIIMSIMMRYGIRNFVFNAKALIKGIMLATGNPIVVNLVVNTIHGAENLSDLTLKRTLLFLLALASGVSVDSCMVKDPEHLADLFTHVIQNYKTDASGKPVFRREDVLPANEFPKEFADDAWAFLHYVSDRFGKVPMTVEGSASTSASENPYQGYGDEIMDDESITSSASEVVNRDSVPEGLMRHSFDCFVSAMFLLTQEKSSIMGLASQDSMEFLIRSLLTCGVRPKASVQFMQLGKLLSIIEKIGVKRYDFFHTRSGDFRSMFCALVRFTIPQFNLDAGQLTANIFLSECFAEDFRSMKRGMNLQSCMVKLYRLFRQELHDDKRRCLDASFVNLFPQAKFPEIAAVPPPQVVAAAVHSSPAAAGGGGNVVLSFADLTPEQLAVVGLSLEQLAQITEILAATRPH